MGLTIGPMAKKLQGKGLEARRRRRPPFGLFVTTPSQRAAGQILFGATEPDHAAPSIRRANHSIAWPAPLGTTSQAVPFELHSGAIDESMAVTPRLEPRFTGMLRCHVNRLWHQHDTPTVDVRPAVEVGDHLLGVTWGRDDKLELVGVVGDEPRDDGIVHARRFVSPVPGIIRRRTRITQLGTDRHQVTDNRQIDCRSRLDRNVPIRCMQSGTQINEIGIDHRFPSRDHDMSTRKSQHVVEHIIPGHGLPFRGYRRVRSITEAAAQIASAGAQEYRLCSDEESFSLP